MENTAPTPPEATRPLASAARPAARRDRSIALVCAVLLLIGMPIGYLPGTTGDAIGLVVLSIVSLALIGGIVFWLVPRERAAPPERANRTALILGILAVLTVLVFWTGLPFPLGAGAIALGLSLRESVVPPAGAGRATAAVALGALGVLASFVILLVG